MKKYETRDGEGALFKNNDKEAEQQPDYKGSIKVDGHEYWLSAWIATSKAGTKYMRLSAQLKAPKHDVPKDAPKSAPRGFSGPVPF